MSPTRLSMSAPDALRLARGRPQSRWPAPASAEDRLAPDCRPVFIPSFHIAPDEPVFAIGSCFARHIEATLAEAGQPAPMLSFALPAEEQARFGAARQPAGLLNKYTPASMLEELTMALDGGDSGQEFVVPHGEGWIDLSLNASYPVSQARAMARRAEISALFAHALRSCRVAIVTLGLIESWLDEETGRVLTIAPPPPLVAAHPGRFTFFRPAPTEVIAQVEAVLRLIHGARGRRGSGRC
ncbi:GSCFA domain-containing protein [Pseudoroseicyclus tamaricis]|uniref:GSCFA domain-containing protein n=1 Tax=Pseudoroseicyclus tamaricis TaxID=2705421 RepID=A0A6B2JJD0_9RHOB|nr:GSCFA domain-containing protein [Pseudoroseicyclus tamaricis]NDV01541.1 GSCFA domain-containing protein [Pseudoroseicyclus tamaricis]